MTDNAARLPLQLTLHDEGNHDRVVATAIAIYRPA
jgi:hypothetical protein